MLSKNSSKLTLIFNLKIRIYVLTRKNLNSSTSMRSSSLKLTKRKKLIDEVYRQFAVCKDPCLNLTSFGTLKSIRLREKYIMSQKTGRRMKAALTGPKSTIYTIKWLRDREKKQKRPILKRKSVREAKLVHHIEVKLVK